METQVKPSPRKGGRPVKWIGGGGLSQKFLVGKGVPELRALFLQVFGHPTASNNSAWLRRKLSEPPDEVPGRGRSAKAHRSEASTVHWRQSKHSPQASPGAKRKYGATLSWDSVDTWDGGRPQGGLLPRWTPAMAHALRKLQALAEAEAEQSGTAAQEAVEVFWPEGDDGGSWWPARVVEVSPEKYACKVEYATGESEDLDLTEILSARHLTFARDPLLALGGEGEGGRWHPPLLKGAAGSGEGDAKDDADDDDLLLSTTVAPPPSPCRGAFEPKGSPSDCVGGGFGGAWEAAGCFASESFSMPEEDALQQAVLRDILRDPVAEHEAPVPWSGEDLVNLCGDQQRLPASEPVGVGARCTLQPELQPVGAPLGQSPRRLSYGSGSVLSDGSPISAHIAQSVEPAGCGPGWPGFGAQPYAPAADCRWWSTGPRGDFACNALQQPLQFQPWGGTHGSAGAWWGLTHSGPGPSEEACSSYTAAGSFGFLPHWTGCAQGQLHNPW
eukprot:CAMPEP_0177594874 /NCGR_PEP_ID=MMETSP0419_2-20121207/10026_1 /TAXON_ID=582737 /ORGANISM="Tetraselmis sp., Strain GSL018" /LENGTH=499 /DNA_ID=CAMNT_0019086237 /DNA_START=293 /DNA_END=1789 /DNA_ORIENTATION=-